MKTLLAALFAALALGVAAADDKKDDTPKAEDKKKDDKKDMVFTGVWTRESESGVKLTFTFKTKTELTIKAAAGDGEMVATCKYTVEKEKADKDAGPRGTLKLEVTKVETKNDFPMAPEKGYKMKFKLAVAKDKKAAKLTEFEADNADHVRDVVEGEYKAKKDEPAEKTKPKE